MTSQSKDPLGTALADAGAATARYTAKGSLPQRPELPGSGSSAKAAVLSPNRPTPTLSSPGCTSRHGRDATTRIWGSKSWGPLGPHRQTGRCGWNQSPPFPSSRGPARSSPRHRQHQPLRPFGVPSPAAPLPAAGQKQYQRRGGGRRLLRPDASGQPPAPRSAARLAEALLAESAAGIG